jgi:hypothetical protein
MQNLFKIGFIVLVMAFSSTVIYSQNKILVTKSITAQKTKQTTKNGLTSIERPGGGGGDGGGGVGSAAIRD